MITNSRNLELIPNGDDVIIQVTYNVIFSPLERHLALNGLVFQERIRVIGEDPGTATDQILHTFPFVAINAAAQPAGNPIPRSRSIQRSRASLWEDFDNVSEIRCRIEIRPIGFPANYTAFTDQEEIQILGLQP